MSKYFQEPLKYSGEVGETEIRIKNINMNKRIITNSLGTDEPVDLYDGMFFLKDNYPEENERTLYLNYKGTLKEFVHINADGSVDIASGGSGGGGNSETIKINLAGSNVLGYLPLSKLSTGTDTLDNTNNFIVVDTSGNIKIVDKQELLDLITAGSSVDLSLYMTIENANKTFATKEELADGLDTKQDVGNYATMSDLTGALAGKQDIGDYATTEELTTGLAGKQDKGNYMPFVANDSSNVNKVDEDVTIDLSVGNCWVGIIKSENTTPNIIFTNIGKYRIRVTTFSINLSSIANNYVRILTTTTANQSSTSYTSRGYLRTFEITRIE